MNSFGTYVPVAFLVSKYGNASIIRDFLDHLALDAGREPNQDRHLNVPSDTEKAHRTGGFTKHHVNAVRNFCPSHIVIDVAVAEISAIETCMWGIGAKCTYAVGIGLMMTGMPNVARIVYCSWHLKCAWGRKLKELVQVGEDRDKIMAALSALIKTEARCGPSPSWWSKPQLWSKPFLTSCARRNRTASSRRCRPSVVCGGTCIPSSSPTSKATT
jgi:hypothetical protein